MADTRPGEGGRYIRRDGKRERVEQTQEVQDRRRPEAPRSGTVEPKTPARREDGEARPPQTKPVTGRKEA